SYEDSTQRIFIRLPDILGPEDKLVPPEWLSATDTDNTFVGHLPDIGSNDMSGGGADGAFVFPAFDWVPPSFKRDITEIRLTTSLPNRGVATGEFVSEAVQGTTYTAVFKPSPNWRETSVFFGPYEIGEEKLDLPSKEVRLRTYFRNEDLRLSDDYLRATKGYIKRFSKEIGPYPLSSYAVVSTPLPVGLAFDGLTYVSQDILAHSYMLDRSLAHEVLHSWWGNSVLVDYATGNWSEGLTTYMADYALAEDRGEDEAKAMRHQWLSDLSRLSDEQNTPLREFQSTSISRGQAIGYGKAAMVFHALKQQIGADAFSEGLQRFWRANEGRVAGWDDIQLAFETASHKDLATFFDQWVDGSELPDYAILSARSDVKDGLHSVELTIDMGPHSGVATVPLVFETDGSPTSKYLELKANQKSYTITLDAKPVSVAVDPDFHTLRQLADSELPVILRDAMSANTVAVFEGSGAKTATDFVVEKLFSRADVVTRQPVGAEEPVADVGAVVGATSEVLATRARFFDDAPTLPMETGQTLVWVEKDARGQVWLFVSAENLDSIATDLAQIRFYARQSWIAFSPNSRPKSDKWSPVSPRIQVVSKE
ncbi:MAG: M1 family aminopeptidase, partial [Planctomycetota bacterium]